MLILLKIKNLKESFIVASVEKYISILEKKMLFFHKKIETKEYLELKKEIDKLRIAIETLDIEVKLYKNKLRTRAKIDKDEETQNINNSVLLPE
jgi:ribosomal protein L1